MVCLWCYRSIINYDLDITNILVVFPQIRNIEVLDITNPLFNEQIWPVLGDFVKSRFHCITGRLNTLAFLISKLRFFVEFDAMKKGGLENLIPGSTFTNISVKNMKGSKNYDNIWISKHAKLHHFTGQAGKEGIK